METAEPLLFQVPRRHHNWSAWTEYTLPDPSRTTAGFAGVDHPGDVRRIGFNMISLLADPFAAKTLH